MMLLCVLCLLAVATASRLAGGSWLNPAAFFSGFWTIICILPVVGAPDYYVPWIGPAWIALACASLSLGCGLGCVAARPDEVPPVPTREAVGYPLAIGICVLVGVSYLVVRIAVLGPVWSFDEDAPDLPAAFQLMLAAQYGGPALGGLYFASGKPRARFFGLLAMLPALLTATVYVRRSWILMSGMFWVGGLLSAWILKRRGPVKLFTVKIAAICGAMFVILGAVAMLFQIFRLGLTGNETNLADTAASYGEAMEGDHVETAWERVRVILFGYPVPFSNWLERSWDNPPEMTWGAWTFAGPSRLLGLSQRTRIEDYFQQGSLGNLYTAFYGLVRDFSWFGALIVLFLFGALSGWGYQSVMRGRTIAIPILVGFYATTIFSPLWSLYRYNALIGAIVYLAVFFGANAWRRGEATGCTRAAPREALA